MEQELLRILRSLKSPRHLLQTHAQLLARGLAASPRLLPALVSAALSAAPSSSSPRQRLAGRGGGGGRGCSPEDALAAYTAMRSAGVAPNGFTFTFLLRACKSLRRMPPCRCVHGQIVRCGFGPDVVVQNALLNLYYKCGDPGEVGAVRKVFDGMPERDVVSWNSIVGVHMASGDAAGAMDLFEAMPERNVVSWNTVVAGFTRVGDMVSARSVFDRMPIRDAISWNLMISGYATRGDVEAARSLFDEMDRKDVVSWTAMVSAYAKTGDIDSAKVLFDRMPVKNLVSWNAMITAYNHNSRYDEALRTFQQMMIEGGFMPDEATLVSVVSACAQLGSTEYCNWVSSYISKYNTHITVALGNALIDMFAKCGDVGRARQGVELDDTVFIAALAACAHGGLLQEGWSIFKQMVEHYGIVPRMEHYGCIVDLLGRAELTDYVSTKIVEIEPFNSSYQVLSGILLFLLPQPSAPPLALLSAQSLRAQPARPRRRCYPRARPSRSAHSQLPATAEPSAANAKRDTVEVEAAKRAADERTARKEARAAALACAVKAEEEAAAATQERDTAVARLRITEECKGAPPDFEEEDAVDDASTVSDQAPNNTHQAMLLHEATAVLNLHAQAVVVQNIRSLIPVILDITSDNYTWWREQFLTVGKYSLQDNVLHDVPALASPDWGPMDCVVRS
ncbi:pentatricopeptide repeat-containing protein At3g21470 [Setaria italica]|uniref:pentatricopeptide repeat-containing protein At3g21470 n=1 Tax=Setaria italica TaxID=4555 RepID=UPI000BE5016C|nr:pentatricopeptide repeat-containing protein At3g21470 [Setaria italica]